MSDGPALLPSSDAAFVPGKVSIVVLNWNAAPFVARALDSIVRHTHRPYELIVVDNGSTDESREVIAAFVRAHPHVDVRRIDHATNLRFSRGMNAGIRASAPDARYVVVFCNDVEVKRDDWLDAMIDAVDRGAAVAGHSEILPVNDEQRDVFRRNEPAYGDERLADGMRALLETRGARYPHVYGYCFLLARRALERAGLYLEHGEFRQYHSDWEWYMRFHTLGFEIADARPGVHHWHSISELIELHPHRYRELLAKMDEPTTLARYLSEGRPLFEEESGHRALAAARGADG